MRIAFSIDTLAVAVAVCVVVSSSAASGVRKASATATFGVSSDRARILRTMDGADKDSEEARMFSLNGFLGFVHHAPEVDLLLTESLLPHTFGADVSTKQAFEILGLHSSPLDGDLSVVATEVTQMEDALDCSKRASSVLSQLANARIKSVAQQETAMIRAELKVKEKLLHTHTQAVAEYILSARFKAWLDHASSKPGEDSLTDGKYVVFRNALGEPEAATLIEMVQWSTSSAIAIAIGESLQKGQFDYWISLGIDSKEGLLKQLSIPVKQTFKMPRMISRISADKYMAYYENRLAKQIT
uniref:Uncharacterized protein n=1 Tax=Peronospora matthiolae TaxID=2874970 RepID=A0AAV1UUZ1_9STRA